MSVESGHIDGERLQGFLEGGLEPSDRVQVERHLRGCAACSEELAAWEGLLRELDGLPRLAPGADFHRRVLEGIATSGGRLPTRESADQARPAAAGGHAGTVLPVPQPGRRRRLGRHPGGDTLQSLVDGTLGGRRAARVRTHLEGCDGCRSEAARWEQLAAALTALPTEAPSSGFAARVVAEVRRRGLLPAPRPAPGLTDRIAAAARALVPASPRARLAASGLLVAPALGLLGLVALLLANPLLGPGDLLTFASWRGTRFVQDGFGWLVQQATGSDWTLLGYEAIQAMLASPALVAATLSVGWILTLGSAWVVYRNVIHPSLPGRRHVRLS